MVEGGHTAFTVAVNGGTRPPCSDRQVSRKATSGADYYATSRTTGAGCRDFERDDHSPDAGPDVGDCETLALVLAAANTSTNAVIRAEWTAAQTIVNDEGNLTMSMTADTTAVADGAAVTLRVTL